MCARLSPQVWLLQGELRDWTLTLSPGGSYNFLGHLRCLRLHLAHLLEGCRRALLWHTLRLRQVLSQSCGNKACVGYEIQTGARKLVLC